MSSAGDSMAPFAIEQVLGRVFWVLFVGTKSASPVGASTHSSSNRSEQKRMHIVTGHIL
jgi:hypothetical protein